MFPQFQIDTTFDLSTYLVERKALVEKALDSSISIVYPEKIYEAMRYSLLAGGKRLRPILCLAASRRLAISSGDKGFGRFSGNCFLGTGNIFETEIEG